MTTKIEAVPVPIVKPRFNWPLALVILALGLILAVFAATTLPTTATKIAGQPVAERADLMSSQDPTLAESATAIERNEASRQQAIEADVARYSGLAGFYTAGNEATLPASLVDNPELMLAHRYIFVVENRIAPDQDIGLMEFFTVPNEATLPASLVDNPELMLAHRYVFVENRADPDQDIGLMEFFTVPNETSGQRVKSSTSFEPHN